MARAHVNQNSIWPYHITGRCPNREPFRIPLPWMWSIMEDYLYYLHHVYELKIYAFVLMPNHFHLLCGTPTKKIGDVIQELMWKSSKEINAISGRINQNWGGRHFKCELNKANHFINTYKYVYQNPLRSNLVKRVEDWPYSTLNGLVGNSKLIIPIAKDTILFNNNLDFKKLDWLNQLIDKKYYDEIKIALSRKTFCLPKTKSKRLSDLENLIL